MSTDAIGWLLCAVVIALGIPLGWLTSELTWPQLAGILIVVHLMCVSFYLIGSL